MLILALVPHCLQAMEDQDMFICVGEYLLVKHKHDDDIAFVRVDTKDNFYYIDQGESCPLAPDDKNLYLLPKSALGLSDEGALLWIGDPVYQKWDGRTELNKMQTWDDIIKSLQQAPSETLSQESDKYEILPFMRKNALAISGGAVLLMAGVGFIWYIASGNKENNKVAKTTAKKNRAALTTDAQ
jgi:hypothetical protein